MTQVSSFGTTYFKDPWVSPSPCDLREGIFHVDMAMPLSANEISYREIQQAIVDYDPTPSWI